VSGQAVVVGATGAVGGAILRRLRKEGLSVVAVARDAEALDQLAGADPGVRACPADIGQDAARDRIAGAVADGGPVRMVVQATGLPPTGPLERIEPDALGLVVALKLGGLLRLVRGVDGQLAPGSRIVAIGGHFGSEPSPRTCAAGVTNAALANLVRQLADAYGPRGVTAHLVAPGPLDTERLHRIATETAAARVPRALPAGPADQHRRGRLGGGHAARPGGRRAARRHPGPGQRRPPRPVLAAVPPPGGAVGGVSGGRRGPCRPSGSPRRGWWGRPAGRPAGCRTRCTAGRRSRWRPPGRPG
jgi:NAD(P)-dependent dehydrogenase (short-subunit alcohol dehydrogenase family)